MRIQDRRIDPAKGGLSLNLDDDLRNLGPHESRFIQNLIQRNGDKLEVEPGMFEEDLFTLPAGDNKVIGWAPYTEENSLILYVYNSNSNHCILQVSFDDNYFPYKIVDSEPILGFEEDKLILHANVIDDKLYWVNNGLTEAMKINLKRAVETHHPGQGGGADPYASIDEQTLLQIKYPPHYPPSVELFTDSSRPNYITPYGHTFRYRYIYDDNEKSVFSPMTAVLHPDVDLKQVMNLTHWKFNNYVNRATAEGVIKSGVQYMAGWKINAQDNYYNGYRITIKVGHHTCKRIEIVAYDPVKAIWHVIHTVDNQELLNTYNTGDEIEIFDWYGDNSGEVISDVDIARAEDILPRNPKTQEFLSINRLAHGNFIDGFNLPTPNMSAEVNQSIHNLGEIGKIGSNQTTYFAYSQPNKSFAYTIPSSWVVEGNIIRFDYYITTPTHLGQAQRVPILHYIVTDEDEANGLSFLYDRLKDAFEKNQMQVIKLPYSSLPALALYGSTKEYGVILDEDSPVIAQFRFDGVWCNNLSIETGHKKSVVRTYKSYSSYQFGLVYKDKAGRRSSVLTQDECLVNTEYPDSGKKYEMQLNINHTHPSWAESFDVVCTWNLTWADYIQFAHQLKGVLERNVPITLGGFQDMVIMSGEIGRSFDFQIGDYVRKILDAKALQDTTVAFENRYFTWENDSDDIYRVQSVSIEDGDVAVDVRNISQPVDILEFMKKYDSSDEKIYYETGHSYPVASAPTSITITEGDCYLKYRASAVNQYETGGETFNVLRIHLAEDPEWSDLFPSRDINGRYFAVNDDFKEEPKPNLLRYGGVYREGTEINNLNRFEANQEAKLLDAGGEIRYTKQIGYVLKILQDRKLTSAYVGRSVPVNPDGTEDILLTDKVLGAIVPSNDEYGTVDPESCVIKDRNLYFFDRYFGQVIRNAPNGSFPISDYKATSLFDDLGSWLKGRHVLSGGAETIKKMYGQIRAGWNDDISSYVISFKQITNPNTGLLISDFEDFTISFKEGENRWKSFHTYNQDLYAHFGSLFFSFVADSMKIHNLNPIRCKFNGERAEVKVAIPCNIGPNKVKSFEAIGIQYRVNTVNLAQDQTDSQRFEVDPIIVEPSEMYPSGMESRLKKSDFVLREGVYYSEFKRDLNTPHPDYNRVNPDHEKFLLIEGRVLRGNVAEIMLKGDITEEVILSSVIIETQSSEISD